MFTSGCRLMFGTSLAFTWVVCLLINPSAACSSCLPISFGNKVQQSHYKRPLIARSGGPFMSMEDSSPPGCATAPWEVRKPEGSERMSDFFPLHVHGHIDSAWSIFHQRCWIHFLKKKCLYLCDPYLSIHHVVTPLLLNFCSTFDSDISGSICSQQISRRIKAR